MKKELLKIRLKKIDPSSRNIAMVWKLMCFQTDNKHIPQYNNRICVVTKKESSMLYVFLKVNVKHYFTYFCFNVANRFV